MILCLRGQHPSRWGTQAPFTNITLDGAADLADQNCIIIEMRHKYRVCGAEMDMVNRLH